MTETVPLLRELVLLAGLSLAVSLLCGRLRVPAVTGFILTGVLIGPGGFGIIQNPSTIHTLADIGVVVLLFTIGLEFSLADLRALGLRSLLAGTLQVLLTAALVAGALTLTGLHPARAIFFGLVVAISSTTLLLKVLTETGALRAPHGQLTLAVSLIQDLSLVPLTLLAPLLADWAAGRATPSFGLDDLVRLLTVTVGAAVVIPAAWRWLPMLLGQASKARSREAFLAGTALVVLGSAYLSEAAGLSLALGAFLGGLMLAGSELSSQVAADLLPFRDTLSSVFFISIGMLFVPSQLGVPPAVVAGVAVGVIVAKFAAAAVAARISRFPWPVSLATAFGLAHVGEFAFVLAQTGARTNLLPPDWTQVFIIAALGSIIVAPWLAGAGPRWAIALDARFHLSHGRPGDEALAPDHGAAPLTNHVVIAGFGLNGRNVARVLRAVRIPHMVVDQAPDKIAACGVEGSPALLGNAAQVEILRRAGIERARALVVALSDRLATRHATRLARQMNKGLFILVRTRYVHEVDGFYAAGANLVIPEEFETSIEIFTAVLRQFHVPHNIVEAQIGLLRRERYSILRGQKLPGSVLDQLQVLLAEGTTETALVLQHSPAVGRSLADLGLDDRSGGCRAIAVVRGGRAITEGGSDFRLEVGDTLVLLGAHVEIDAALERLMPTAIAETGAEEPR
jgi:CPA2 family monovalent cation:H+ antiporter-2